MGSLGDFRHFVVREANKLILYYDFLGLRVFSSQTSKCRKMQWMTTHSRILCHRSTRKLVPLKLNCKSFLAQEGSSVLCRLRKSSLHLEFLQTKSEPSRY